MAQCYRQEDSFGPVNPQSVLSKIVLSETLEGIQWIPYFAKVKIKKVMGSLPYYDTKAI